MQIEKQSLLHNHRKSVLIVLLYGCLLFMVHTKHTIVVSMRRSNLSWPSLSTYGSLILAVQAGRDSLVPRGLWLQPADDSTPCPMSPSLSISLGALGLHGLDLGPLRPRDALDVASGEAGGDRPNLIHNGIADLGVESAPADRNLAQLHIIAGRVLTAVEVDSWQVGHGVHVPVDVVKGDIGHCHVVRLAAGTVVGNCTIAVGLQGQREAQRAHRAARRERKAMPPGPH